MPRALAVATTFLALAAGTVPHPSASAKAHPKPKPVSSATTRAEPQLNIAISDGRTAAAKGDRLTYTIKVQNLGTTNASKLEISQTLPAGLVLVSSDHGGTANAGRVSWIMSLKPGEVSTVATVGQVGATPGDLLRLAAVACATVKGQRKPLVCATHSDLLPTAAAAGPPQRKTHWIWYGAGSVGLLVAGLAMFISMRRRTSIRSVH
jgi:uncharacterized repeat protein (TIGR01451 family)